MCTTFSVQFGVMSEVAMKDIGSPGEFLKKLPMGSYVYVENLPGTRSAAKSATSRAAARGEIVFLRRGLYYKGKRTRYGIPVPSAEIVALEVLGKNGIGPTGVSAARALNLTTQIPAMPELVTSGPVPTGLRGVRIHKRNNIARYDLNYVEIAVLEVLRDWKFTSEVGWEGLVNAVNDRIENREIRPSKLLKAVKGEHSPNVKSQLRELFEGIKTDATTN